MGNFSSATGTVTLLMMLLGRTIFQKFGWKFAALVTPTVSTLTGGAIALRDYLNELTNADPLIFA